MTKDKTYLKLIQAGFAKYIYDGKYADFETDNIKMICRPHHSFRSLDADVLDGYLLFVYKHPDLDVFVSYKGDWFYLDKLQIKENYHGDRIISEITTWVKIYSDKDDVDRWTKEKREQCERECQKKMCPYTNKG